MPIFLIAVVAVILVIVAGLLFAQGAARFDEAVQKNKEAVTKPGNSFNMALTMGYKIPVDADVAAQMREARILAAKQAAATPRGANMGIGRLGQPSELKSAWQGVDKDPITAVKIAAHHGWDGLRTGAVVKEEPAAAPAAAPTAGGKVELVPGKDYPVIEITDTMPPADKRKARIANAKAKSAAKKAAKAAAVTIPATTAPAASTPSPEASPANVPPPPELVEITDEMAPEDKRKARIANSKAKSAYKKALKAAGIDPKSVRI